MSFTMVAASMINIHPLSGIALMLGVLGILIGAAYVLGQRGLLSTEAQRKTVHLGMGAVALSLPWLFEDLWPVWTIAGLALGFLALLRWHPWLKNNIGRVLHGVNRHSWGDLCFPVAVALLFTFAEGNRTLYLTPLLVLSLADTMGALVGRGYGRRAYQTSGGTKSLEGSLAFFLTSFFAVHVPVLLGTDTGRLESLLIAVTISLLVMMLEGLLSYGWDNLVVPLAVFALLHFYLGMSPEQLILRSTLLSGLLLVSLVCHRASGMDGGALLGASLFAFVSVLLGCAFFMWLCAVYFLGHLHYQRRKLRVIPVEIATLYPFAIVCSVAFPGLVWLLLHLHHWVPDRVAFPAFVLTLAMHFLWQQRGCGMPRWYALLISFGLMVVPGAVILFPVDQTLRWSFVCLALLVLIPAAWYPITTPANDQRTEWIRLRHWQRMSFTALAGSATTLLFWPLFSI